ncbi:protein of unknown function [Candidatus Hydrogenisulfobacillus filiaventi]|uniref:Uncharacterized protein n=1 Tax=Candidatus Hydrogenisulfobacillus filiaventi TaxID=2707344 RepID=A0A6F8ZD55_9FIRM|nr:protein of unknown function [Candidatus Hydrogenisulfobacillus filiaventi]
MVNPASGAVVAEMTDAGPGAPGAAREAVAAGSLARLMASEMGKLLREARADVQCAARFVKWYAEEWNGIAPGALPARCNCRRTCRENGPRPARALWLPPPAFSLEDPGLPFLRVHRPLLRRPCLRRP